MDRASILSEYQFFPTWSINSKQSESKYIKLVCVYLQIDSNTYIKKQNTHNGLLNTEVKALILTNFKKCYKHEGIKIVWCWWNNK